MKVTPIRADGREAVLFEVGGEAGFAILQGDLDPESGETLAQAAALAEVRLREAIAARLAQSSLARLTRAVAWSLAATAFHGALLLFCTCRGPGASRSRASACWSA